MFAGLYDREEALNYCFDGENNGYCDVYAVPIRKALDEGFFGPKRIAEFRKRLALFKKYVSDDDVATVIF